MYEDGIGLREQRTFVRYKSQQEALKFLGSTLTDERGIALLHGPKSSGKSVLATQFVRDVQADLAVAVVDGARMKTHELLSRILEQFGYNIVLDSTDEMLNMLNVFVVQQVRSRQAPLLILENINEMFPSALGALCKLASLKANNRHALRLVLVSNRDIGRIIQSPSMSPIAERVIGNYELGPMTSQEALRYLYAKLRSGGVDHPDDIFSVEVCEKLHALSGGLPGDLDAMALSIMEQAYEYPVRLDDIVDPNAPVQDSTPKLIVTLRGEAPREVRLTEKRALLGRSDLSDIVIRDQFVSGQHALLIRDKNAVVLVDLKSRNGTFVNSRRVRSKVLLHNDIVSLGDHRLKIIYADGHSMIEIDDPDLADTAKMQNIANARRQREEKIPTLVAVASARKQ
jgi:type II secretory pathway predicted ATPase ExeA